MGQENYAQMPAGGEPSQEARTYAGTIKTYGWITLIICGIVFCFGIYNITNTDYSVKSDGSGSTEDISPTGWIVASIGISVVELLIDLIGVAAGYFGIRAASSFALSDAGWFYRLLMLSFIIHVVITIIRIVILLGIYMWFKSWMDDHSYSDDVATTAVLTLMIIAIAITAGCAAIMCSICFVCISAAKRFIGLLGGQPSIVP